MKSDSRNILKFCHRLSFSSYATLKHYFDQCITLHNLRMLLTYIVTLYHIHLLKLCTRDVVTVHIVTVYH